MWTQQTKLVQITAFSVGITILNLRIIWKDDIEFVTEFPCFLGHPVVQWVLRLKPVAVEFFKTFEINKKILQSHQYLIPSVSLMSLTKPYNSI